ncbi:MAG: OsmC family protein [Planctomycetes bacterium]|nr:OsmC family protein [Planctomycetota bacterium]
MAMNLRLVSVEHIEGARLSVNIGPHEIISDRPEDEGGTDTGPMSSELLVAALGACMTGRLARYCQSKDFSTKGLCVDLAPELAQDGSRIASIAVDITLPEGFPEDRLVAAQRVVDGCAVHNTLRNPPKIDIEFDIA